MKPKLFDVKTVESRVLCFHVEMNDGKIKFIENKIKHVEGEVNKLLALNNILYLERKRKERIIPKDKNIYFTKSVSLPKLFRYIFPNDTIRSIPQKITINVILESIRNLKNFASQINQGVLIDEEYIDPINGKRKGILLNCL